MTHSEFKIALADARTTSLVMTKKADDAYFSGNMLYSDYLADLKKANNYFEARWNHLDTLVA